MALAYRQRSVRIGTVPVINPILLAISLVSFVSGQDRFDVYSRPALAKLINSETVVIRKKVSTEDLAEHDRVLPKVSASFLVVRTNGNRFSKLQVVPGRQKVGDDKFLPVLIVEKFVTFKDGEERAIASSGSGVTLYPGFRLNLDLGQIVPDDLPGDLFVRTDTGQLYAEPIGKAQMWQAVLNLPDPLPAQSGKPVPGEKFLLEHWNGSYLLHDDGRRSGTLEIRVDSQGEVNGSYYSAKDGSKYEVRGKTGPAPHAIQFGIRFPRTEQIYQGCIFTGDLGAIAGTSKFGDRETAFYAIRKTP